MNNLILIIVSVAGVSIAAIIALCVHFRKIINKKNQGIIRQISEQDRLKRELETIHTEKKVMEKFLNAKIEGVLLISNMEKE
jgi:hypothetical protein